MPAETPTRVGRVRKELVSESFPFLWPIAEREQDEQSERLWTNVERPELLVRDHGRGPEKTEHRRDYRPIVCASVCALSAL
jgi:hypothetical protein